MRILLTGGSGFIGQNLRESLATAHEIHAPSRGQLDLANSDDVARWLSSARFDAIIHAATPAVPHCEQILRGYYNLVRFRPPAARLLFFGSGAEFGKHRELKKASEEEIGGQIPGDSYGFGKLLCTLDARRSTNILNLRLFGVYGRGERYLFKFISNAIVKVLLGLDVVVSQDVVFDYLLVDDLTQIVSGLLEAKGDCPFADINATPSQSVALSGVLGILRRVSGRDFGIQFESPGLNLEYTGSNQRLLKVLPHLSFTSYEVGIARLYHYYSSILSSLDRDAVIQDEYRARCRPRVQELAEQG